MNDTLPAEEAEADVLPTDGEATPAVTSKDDPSVKELALEAVGKVVPNKEGRVFFLKSTVHVGEVQFRPFDRYFIEKGWLNHAKRLSSVRDKPITTPLGKKLPSDVMVASLSKMIKSITDPDLKRWEELEMWEPDFVRGEFQPLMYLARIVLFQSKWYPVRSEVVPRAYEIPKFEPLRQYSDLYIRPDARTANVGFPELTQLSRPGEKVTDSPVYVQVIQGASQWRERIRNMPKITPASVAAVSPPTAVFERAQSGGRAVMAISKHIAFNQMLVAQPLYAALESACPWYMSGDLKMRLTQAQAFLNESEVCLIDGDDLIVHCGKQQVCADASAFESSIRDIDIEKHVQTIEEVLKSEMSTIYRATKQAAGACELALNCGIGKLPAGWGVRSGEGDTHWIDSAEEYDRVMAADRNTTGSFLSDLSRFGIYRLEVVFDNACMISRAYTPGKDPEIIHASLARTGLSFVQREQPVLRRNPSEMGLIEDSRVVMVLGRLYSHPHFDEMGALIKQYWTIKHGRDAVMKEAEDQALEAKVRPGVGKDVPTGEIEREGIKAALDILS